MGKGDLLKPHFSNEILEAVTRCLALIAFASAFHFGPSYARGPVSIAADRYVLPVTAKRRMAPAPVSPVSSHGIRYEVVHWGKSRGLGQNGGYIAAIDLASGHELWVLKVYDVTYDGDLEGDKADVFITKLSLVADGTSLEIANERGARYRVDLASRMVALQ
jgi:hypothetical protein